MSAAEVATPLREQPAFTLWFTHADRCAACKAVDPERTGTFSLACLRGVELLKDAWAAKARAR